MKFSDLPRDPARAFSHSTLAGAHLVFRSNILEPVLVTLDGDGNVDAERPDSDIGTALLDGWEEVDPLPATGIVRDDATFRDPPAVPPVDP